MSEIDLLTFENQNPLILSFGKFKGRNISDLKEEFDYCKWLINQPFISDEIKIYINENINLNDYLMRWGKYKNRNISYIKKHDSQYIKWLKNNDFVLSKCPKLLEILNSTS